MIFPFFLFHTSSSSRKTSRNSTGISRAHCEVTLRKMGPGVRYKKERLRGSSPHKSGSIHFSWLIFLLTRMTTWFMCMCDWKMNQHNVLASFSRSGCHSFHVCVPHQQEQRYLNFFFSFFVFLINKENHYYFLNVVSLLGWISLIFGFKDLVNPGSLVVYPSCPIHDVLSLVVLIRVNSHAVFPASANNTKKILRPKFRVTMFSFLPSAFNNCFRRFLSSRLLSTPCSEPFGPSPVFFMLITLLIATAQHSPLSGTAGE